MNIGSSIDQRGATAKTVAVAGGFLFRQSEPASIHDDSKRPWQCVSLAFTSDQS